MNRAAILVMVFVFASSPLLLAAEVFDSPGRGYREQRDRAFPQDAPTPIQVERALRHVKLKWPGTTLVSRTPPAALTFEPVAQYSVADEGALAQIKRKLNTAGIAFTMTESAGGIVHVRPEDVAEAKALLREVATAGHWSVKTLSNQDGRTVVDP